MACLLDLPVELLTLIAEFVDDWNDFKALRLCNQTLAACTTRELFNTVDFYPDEDGCRRAKAIFDAGLSQHIQHVIIHLDDLGQGVYNEDLESSATDDEGSSTSSEEEWLVPPQEARLPADFEEIILRLATIPNLHHAVLRFDRHCCLARSESWNESMAPQTDRFREHVLNLFFSSLASLPKPVREVHLFNLQNVNPTERNTVECIKKVLGGLHCLGMEVTNEVLGRQANDNLEVPQPFEFFKMLPRFWFKPCMANLQHLSLSSGITFGLFPKLDLRDVHFPQLRSLRLVNVHFCHDSQLEWILSHGDTLRDLILFRPKIVLFTFILNENIDRCYIHRDEMTHSNNNWHTGYMKRWHHYFRAFQARLVCLKLFLFSHGFGATYESGPNTSLGLAEERYGPFIDDIGVEARFDNFDMFRVLKPPCDDEDQEALCDLLRSIGQSISDYEQWVAQTLIDPFKDESGNESSEPVVE